MKQLDKYLEDIARAVLEPVGRWYSGKQVINTIGYSGIHSTGAQDSMWQPWTVVCTLEIPDTDPANKAGTYILYWTEDNGIQGSWWAKV